ncbi:MAG TPA: MlaD family protein [Syntrophales bacterium]|nr:MlaD family protein [Syntrophales bacterium]
MELKFSRMDRAVGIFIIAVLSLMVGSVVLIGRGKDWFRPTVTYYAQFKENYNLAPGSPVKLYKADIGKVRSVSLVGDAVRVRLSIFEEYHTRFREDTVVTVESPTFIGSEYVAVRPGKPESRLVEPGGTVKSEEKRTLSEVLAEYEVEETAKRLTETIRNLADIIDELRDPEGPLFGSLNAIEKNLRNVELVTNDLKEGKGTVGQLLRSDELIDRVNTSMERLDNVLKNLEGATPGVTENLKESMEKIREITANLEKGSRDVPAVIRATQRGIREIRDGVDEINRVVKSLEKNPLIKGNLPPKPEGKDLDAGLRR